MKSEYSPYGRAKSSTEPEDLTTRVVEPMTDAEEERVYDTLQLWSDDFALKVAMQDFQAAEAYRSQNHDWRWRTHDELYLTWQRQLYWEGTRMQRSSIGIYLSFEQIEALIPKQVAGVFSENPWFQAEPEPGTSNEDARKMRDFVLKQMDEAGAEEVIRRWFKSGNIYGNGIMELSWELGLTKRLQYISTYKQQTTKMTNPQTGQVIELPTGYKRVLEKKEITSILNRPMLANVAIQDFYIDPNCQSPRVQDPSCRFAAVRTYMTVDELLALREADEFRIPSKEQLIDLADNKPGGSADSAKGSTDMFRGGSWAPQIDQTVDPGGKRIEVIRYCTNERWVWALNGRYCCYNKPNPYGFKPFYNYVYADVPSRFYGLGVCDVLEGEQRLQGSILNSRIDELALNIHRPVIKRRGIVTPAYMLRQRPGQILEADDPQKDFLFPEMPNVTQQAFVEIQASDIRAQKITGLSDLAVLGTASGGGNSAARTATGVGVQAQASQTRIQYSVWNAERTGIEPMLNAVLRLNQLYPPMENVQVENQADGSKGYLPPETIINSTLKFRLRGSDKMKSQLMLAQSFPLVFQTLANPALLGQLAKQGLSIDWKELVKMLWDMTGYKSRGEIVIAMSEEEKKMMGQPAPDSVLKKEMQDQRIQGQAAAQDKKLAADNETVSDKGQIALMAAILPHLAKSATELDKPNGKAK